MNDVKTENLWLMHGNCLDRMKEIPDGSVDMTICEVTTLYLNGSSMRQIAKKLNTNHKRISRLLKSNGVATKEPKNLRGRKKFACDKTRAYNNMATHLRFDVSVEWLLQFEDFNKLKVLNEVITKRFDRWDVSTEWYKEYIGRSYKDANFNTIYEAWVRSGKEKYRKPSLDHIIPKAKGGTNALDNLQFMTWFENRCKNDMDQDEWVAIKNNIKEYFI